MENQIKIPQEIVSTIEKYKNQATTMGIEVNRLKSLKAQIEVEISKLISTEEFKKEAIKTIQGQIDKYKIQLKELEDRRNVLAKEEKTLANEMSEARKDIKERIEVLRVSEKENKNERISIEKAKNEITERKKENAEIKNDLERKIGLIKELNAKL